MSTPSDRSENPVIYPGHEDADPERPLYQDITVKLTGLDGNIGGIMGRVREALTQAGTEQALQAVMRIVNAG